MGDLAPAGPGVVGGCQPAIGTLAVPPPIGASRLAEDEVVPPAPPSGWLPPPDPVVLRPGDRPGVCLCPSGGLRGNMQDPLAPLEPGCRYRALPHVFPYTGGWNAHTRCAYCVITPRMMNGLDGRSGRCLCMCDLCGPLADFDGRGLQLSMIFSAYGRAACTGTLVYHAW